METKSNIIAYINKTYRAGLSNSNSSFSSINVAKRVWWTNVPLKKFSEPVHLLFNDTDEVFWIVLPKNFVASLSDNFRIRTKKGSANQDFVDIEVWAGNDEQYMKDVKSGGTGFDFKPFIKERIAKGAK